MGIKVSLSNKNKSESRLRQYHVAYMDIAKRWSLLSYAVKKQVGAIIVKDGMIISDGFNGTPSGFDNVAEDECGKTHWYTLHAEANAILKLTASTQNSAHSTLYVTCAPCRDCAKLIYQSKITTVIYLEDYKTSDGVEFLKKAGIEVRKMNEIQNNFTDITDSFFEGKDSNNPSDIYKTISKSHLDNDFESIDRAADFLIRNYGDNIGIIRAYLMATNLIKSDLKNRNNVYIKAIQVCDNSGLNTEDFLKNLR